MRSVGIVRTSRAAKCLHRRLVHLLHELGVEIGGESSFTAIFLMETTLVRALRQGSPVLPGHGVLHLFPELLHNGCTPRARKWIPAPSARRGVQESTCGAATRPP